MESALNRALLPILARLHSLQTPSRLAPDGGRIIASRSDPLPIIVMLREINETVLNRRLGFQSETGTRLTLEVAGRRILRMTEATGVGDAQVCLDAPVLEDQHKDNLIKALQAFATPRQEIRLTSEPSPLGAEGLSVGLPVALIADLLLVELNGLDAEVISDLAAAEPPPEPEVAPLAAAAVEAEAEPSAGPVGRFARANGSVLMAWLIAGGPEDGAVEGPEEMIDHLRGFLDDEITDLGKQLDRLSHAPGEPICLALGASLRDGHSILCARADGSVLLGLAEGDCTMTLMQSWTTAFG